MCDQHNATRVRVLVPADLSFSGHPHWKDVGIDTCIASVVAALQDGGVNMRGSCCGHGKEPGEILLQDGRVLVIKEEAWCGKSVRRAMAPRL